VGDRAMSPFNTFTLLLAAFLGVYLEATFTLPRRLLGAQIDLLPALIVYAALFLEVPAVALLAVLGGAWFDAFSANPLGISILPLFVVGFTIHQVRELVLRELRHAQFLLGLAASALVPLLTLLLLLNLGHEPLLGWGLLWQWFVMALAGAAATPFCIHFFAWIQRRFRYAVVTQTSFRPDREIKRGRA
jgi:cell shape-determining protein MreD